MVDFHAWSVYALKNSGIKLGVMHHRPDNPNLKKKKVNYEMRLIEKFLLFF